MASLNRDGYLAVYKFARDVYLNSRSKELRAQAVDIVDLCEMVIGQQPDSYKIKPVKR